MLKTILLIILGIICFVIGIFELFVDSSCIFKRMKYRIIKKTFIDNHSEFYVQYKALLFWHYEEDGYTEDIRVFKNKSDAEYFIFKRRQLEHSKTVVKKEIL